MLSEDIYANGFPSIVEPHANGLFLPQKETDIEIIKEDLYFKVDPSYFVNNPFYGLFAEPPSDRIKTSVNYKMKNNLNDYKKINVIFPVTVLIQKDPSIKFNDRVIKPIKKINISIYKKQLRIWDPKKDTYIDASEKLNFLKSPEISNYFSYTGNGLTLYLFELEFKPNETADLNINYTDIAGYRTHWLRYPIYNFIYLLTPAKYWKDFHDLNITFDLPENFVISKSSLQLKDSRSILHHIYTGKFSSLPKEDFIIQYKPVRLYIIPIILWTVFFIILALIIYHIVKRKLHKKSN